MIIRRVIAQVFGFDTLHDECRVLERKLLEGEVMLLEMLDDADHGCDEQVIRAIHTAARDIRVELQHALDASTL